MAEVFHIRAGSTDAESQTDPRVRRLLEDYARLAGARRVEVAPALVELELPLSERAAFGGDGRREAGRSSHRAHVHWPPPYLAPPVGAIEGLE